MTSKLGPHLVTGKGILSKLKSNNSPQLTFLRGLLGNLARDEKRADFSFLGHLRETVFLGAMQEEKIGLIG